MDEAMSEGQLLEAVRAHLDTFGWLWYHTFDSRRSNHGMSDIIALKRTRLLVRELKSEKGRLREAQKMWLEAWATVGADVGVWRPSDLSSGRIEATLRGTESVLPGKDRGAMG